MQPGGAIRTHPLVTRYFLISPVASRRRSQPPRGAGPASPVPGRRHFPLAACPPPAIKSYECSQRPKHGPAEQRHRPARQRICRCVVDHVRAECKHCERNHDADRPVLVHGQALFLIRATPISPTHSRHRARHISSHFQRVVLFQSPGLLHAGFFNRGFQTRFLESGATGTSRIAGAIPSSADEHMNLAAALGVRTTPDFASRHPHRLKLPGHV